MVRWPENSVATVGRKVYIIYGLPRIVGDRGAIAVICVRRKHPPFAILEAPFDLSELNRQATRVSWRSHQSSPRLGVVPVWNLEARMP